MLHSLVCLCWEYGISPTPDLHGCLFCKLSVVLAWLLRDMLPFLNWSKDIFVEVQYGFFSSMYFIFLVSSLEYRCQTVPYAHWNKLLFAKMPGGTLCRMWDGQSQTGPLVFYSRFTRTWPENGSHYQTIRSDRLC